MDAAELHYLILHYVAQGPCQQAVTALQQEAARNGLLPSRMDVFGKCPSSWDPLRPGVCDGHPPSCAPAMPQVSGMGLSYEQLQQRYPHLGHGALEGALRTFLVARRELGRLSGQPFGSELGSLLLDSGAVNFHPPRASCGNLGLARWHVPHQQKVC